MLPFSPNFKFCILAFEYPVERTRLPAYGDVKRLVILGIIRISNRSRFVFSWVVLNSSDKNNWSSMTGKLVSFETLSFLQCSVKEFQTGRRYR